MIFNTSGIYYIEVTISNIFCLSCIRRNYHAGSGTKKHENQPPSAKADGNDFEFIHYSLIYLTDYFHRNDTLKNFLFHNPN